MRPEEVDWVRETFAGGVAAKMRLVSDLTIYECGEAAGITGPAWWKLEHGNPITAHRAETLAPVLRRMRNGEPIGADAGADTAAAPTEEDEATRKVRHEIALLIAAENLMAVGSTDLVKTAVQWESKVVRETRTAARRVLRKRIFELGGEPSTDDSP